MQHMDREQFTAAIAALGLNQSSAARALGVNRATIIRWESGQSRIPVAIGLALTTLRRNAMNTLVHAQMLHQTLETSLALWCGNGSGDDTEPLPHSSRREDVTCPECIEIVDELAALREVRA